MNREIIYVIVVMVFAYIIGKYKLLPYFAAKKILKDSKNGRQDNGTTTVAPSHIPMSYPAMMGGLPFFPTQPQPEKSGRRDMYFEFRIFGIDYDVNLGDLGDAIDNTVSDIFITLRNRGICPDTLNIVNIGEGLLLAYVTYTL